MNHSQYIKDCKKMSSESLRYVIQDCKNAIEAMPDNPKAGHYADEICYCGMELKRRERV
jgi:hypothetical protein